MSYVSPVEVVAEMIAVGRSKLACGSGNVLLRAALAGGILSLAVCLAVTTSVQLDGKIYGAFVFPAGFVILILLGLDLVTGNFAVAPLPLLHGDPLPPGSVLKNWAVVFCGNLIGCCLVAGLVAASMTMGFSGAQSPEADAIQAIAVAKTRDYAALGGSGLIAVVARAILCNWMVTLGVVMAMTSRHTGGKILAMWLPIVMFFGLGYEHAVVNLFVISLGMILGADVSWTDWWLWNQIPVTLGNLLGGLLFTGIGLYAVHGQHSPTILDPPLDPLAVSEKSNQRSG